MKTNHCGCCGLVQSVEIDAIWCKCIEHVKEHTERANLIVALGTEMLEALERGRRLHPWVGPAVQRRAVADEAGELRDAVANEIDQAIYDEAVDCWVTARRLIDGN